MLVLTRRDSESLVIRPAASLDPQMTVAELFADGPIVVHVIGIKGRQAKVGIEAPPALDIARSELLDRPLAEALKAALRR